MTRHILMALAGISLVAGGQALAQGRGGGHGGGHGVGGGLGLGAGLQRGGPDRVNVGIDARTEARANSQGRFHASERARLRANRNSALFVDDDDIDIDARGNARVNSQSRFRASDRARLRANANSAVREDVSAGVDVRTRTRGPRKPRR